MNKTKTNGLLWALIAGGCVYASTVSATLIHRYNFNEAPGSTTVIDSVSGSNGVIRQTTATGGALQGNPVTFDGSQASLDGTGGYIDLPNGIVSGLTNVSIEMWVT
jgi:hypothetical protein